MKNHMLAIAVMGTLISSITLVEANLTKSLPLTATDKAALAWDAVKRSLSNIYADLLAKFNQQKNKFKTWAEKQAYKTKLKAEYMEAIHKHLVEEATKGHIRAGDIDKLMKEYEKDVDVQLERDLGF